MGKEGKFIHSKLKYMCDHSRQFSFNIVTVKQTVGELFCQQ